MRKHDSSRKTKVHGGRVGQGGCFVCFVLFCFNIGKVRVCSHLGGKDARGKV